MTTALTFRPASELSDEALAALVTRGYEGYFTRIAPSAVTFRTMVLANQLELDLSVVAYEGSEPVAFAMLGERGRRGWIGGMGVVPEARGHGYGTRVMDAVLGIARKNAFDSIDLEVIEQNHAALRVYEALGFRQRRWLEVFEREPEPMEAAAAPLGTDVVEPLAVASCLAAYASLHRERSPWQRDLGALLHWSADLEALGVRDASTIRACALYRLDPKGIIVMDLATAKGEPSALLEATLRGILARHPDRALSLTNMPEGDPGCEALRAIGAKVTFRQREMTLRL